MNTRKLERITERIFLFMAGLLLGIVVTLYPLNWNQPKGYNKHNHHRVH